ncbi:MAG: mucoidy inhibitor MuiA family protein [Balneola sp.]|nr:MAG: mucoidy inhibitor MuiA family protein [Balneola sp.]
MLILLLSILFSTTTNPSSDSVQVVTEIEEVTVFKSQAQIQRLGKVDLQVGKNTLVFSGLTETLINQSVQLRGNGSYTLLSITTRHNYSEKPSVNPNLENLQKRKQELELSIQQKNADLKVIDQGIAMLGSTQEIIKNNKLTAAEIEQLLKLYQQNLSELLQDQISIRNEIVAIHEELSRVNLQINNSWEVERTSFKEVIAEVQTNNPQSIDFTLSYQVSNAGWTPSYDIRSSDIDSPLEITYKANIYQRTGIDWEDVKFTINSGDPSSRSTKPELYQNYIGYNSYRGIPGGTANVLRRVSNERGVIKGKVYDVDGELIAGASVMLPGLAIGDVTDQNGMFEISGVPNGFYSLSVMFIGYETSTVRINISNNGLYLEIPLEFGVVGMDELFVRGYTSNEERSGLFTTDGFPKHRFAEEKIEEPTFIDIVETASQTSFSYRIEVPYSVPSDGKAHTLEIKNEFIETDYLYGTVPKLSAHAYLLGNIPDWNELNLLAGEANIYFDNGFVGSTYLDPASSGDTLSVSLGKDERIVLERTKLKDFSSKNFFRNKTRELFTYEITVRNTKSEPVSITVEDQIPVSTNEEIQVSTKELSNGDLNEDTGIIDWKLDIAPGEVKTLRLSYELEYPKGKRIVY